jgi:GNAT superfamily N-acetyltransferase
VIRLAGLLPVRAAQCGTTSGGTWITMIGGKGCFLVAVLDTRSEQNGSSTSAGSIVGIVGGHARDDDDDGVIELRRMSVSSKQQGMGLGKRLIRRLEVECQPSKMYLTCTSMQNTAHRLYSRAGFTLTTTSTPGTASWWFRNSIEIYHFAKEFEGNGT